jgi:hypothetical protein
MKKIKIALICAHPAGTNNGMISVDAAFHRIEMLLNNKIEVTRFCSWRKLSKGDLLNYEHYYSADQLIDYDKIIFWGDFLQWIGYAKNDWIDKSKKMNLSDNDKKLIDIWHSLFLFENNPKLRKKTILFGGTIYGLNSTQLADSRYLNNLTNLLNDSLFVKLRDIYSGNFVSQLSNKKDAFGCDCALLFNSEHIKDQSVVNQEPYFLYSFARSGKELELENFSKMIERELKISRKFIPWIAKGAGLESLEKNITLIKNSKFVITDIYHLSVNSWREGIPAIGIGNGSSIVENTLSDKKKEVFYNQMFGSNYYLYLEDIIDCKINHKDIKKIVESHQAKNIINSYLSNQVSNSIQELINCILN